MSQRFIGWKIILKISFSLIKKMGAILKFSDRFVWTTCDIVYETEPTYQTSQIWIKSDYNYELLSGTNMRTIKSLQWMG